MEANTLRLENYVEYNSMFFKVKMISKSGISCDRGKGIVELSIKDVNPIPLSEDILLKLGFEKIREGKFIHYDLSGYNLVNGNGFYLSYVRPEIKYVHQLQNIFHSLTCEELTIKE